MFRTTPASATRTRRVRSSVLVGAFVVGLLGGGLQASAIAGDRYRVQSGDTLAAIAADFGYGAADGWRVVYDANPRLNNPDHIEPGQRLRIPDPDDKPRRRALPAPRREARASRSAATAPSAPSSSVWYSLAACESGGNWAANTGNGYYGGLQFSLDSWRAVGGTGYPHEASVATQIAMGQRLQASQGWNAWPGCAAELGLG